MDDKDEFNEEELASMLFDNDDEDDDNENSFNIRKIKKDTTGFLDDGNSDVFGMDEDSNISKPDKKESDSRSNILFLKHACNILISQTQFSVGQTAEPNLFHHGESSYRVG